MSSSNKFKYDKVKNKIDHLENKESYIDFFNCENSSNNIQDIIAIVADNGNGKTTLLKLITDLVRINEDSFYSDFIIVISEEHIDFKIYTNINDLDIPEDNDEANIKYESLILGYDDNISAIADKLNMLYYSNAFDNSAMIDNGKKHENVIDISTMYLIKDNRQDDSLMNYIQSEYIRQIEFVTSYQNSEKHLKFDIPKEIYINTEGIDTRMQKLINLVENDKYYKDSSNITDEEYDYRENFTSALESIRYKFNESFEKYMLDACSYTKARLLYLHLVKDIYSYMKDLDFSRLDFYLVSEVMNFSEALDKNNIINSYIEYEKNNELSFCDFRPKAILNGIETKDTLLSPLALNYANNTLIYDIDKILLVLKETNFKLYKEVKKSKATETKYIKSIVYEFFELVCLKGINESMIEIFWPLSSGEYNLLSLYSRLHKVCNSMSENYKYSEYNIVLLLDEGENSLHPKWQQQYVKSIIDLIDDLFDNANIQIILTTHSPILLSDIPGDNVIYLNKDNKHTEKLKTFGSNIYNLYRHGFFLNGSNFGILGDFSTEKLEEVGDIISKWENELNNIEKLTITSENILNEKEDKQTQIKRLEKKKYELLKETREEATDELEYCKNIINIIGEKFIRDTMLEQYNDVCKRLEVEKVNSDSVCEIKDQFEKLTKEEKNEFIKYIIEKRKK